MSPDEQRIAIAEVCGWTRDELCDCWHLGEGKSRVTAFIGLPAHQHRLLPDYLNDLNAMHEAEKGLTYSRTEWSQQDQFTKELDVITKQGIAEHWSSIHSTAAQRAEAFLRTLNLWKETP